MDGPADARKDDGRSVDVLETDESCQPSPKVAARSRRCTEVDGRYHHCTEKLLEAADAAPEVDGKSR